jgi:hypothetical protein
MRTQLAVLPFLLFALFVFRLCMWLYNLFVHLPCTVYLHRCLLSLRSIIYLIHFYGRLALILSWFALSAKHESPN